jgi:ligand-binding sensor domain-containing protein/signal transduction histidine kinase
MSAGSVRWSVCVFAVLVFCLVQPVAYGSQELFGSFTRRTWQMQDGLPEQTVQAFAQTPDGYLWIGTTGGLLRFDGARFVLFDRQNTPALRENSIFCLMVSSDGVLWIGTEGGGLIRYEHGVFHGYTARDGISNDFVRTLWQDADRTIWIGTDNGLLRLRSAHIERIDGAHGVPALAVHSIFRDSRGRLWAGGSKLLCLEKDAFREYILPGEASQNRVKSILETRDGSLWVGTVSGLNRMPPGSDHFVRVSGISGTVRVLRQASDGVLWIGTIGDGIFQYQPDQTFRNPREKFVQLTAADALPSNTILNFFEDNEKNFWIGTQAGMLRLTRTPVSIVPLPEESDSDFGTIYQDRDGSFWIASTRLFHMKDGKIHPAELPGLEAEHVRNVYRDRSGALWAGTDGGGIFRVDHGSVSRFTTSQGLSNNFVRAITQDRDGSMWVTTDEGLNHLIPSGNTYRVHSYQMRDGLVYFSTRVLLEDHQGDLWIGTDGGLSHMRKGAFISDVATKALSHQKIWTIHEDTDGGLWFGTRDSGLFRLKDGTVAHYGTEQGLASNAIYQILEGSGGNFWLSGPNGISLLNRHELDQAATSPSQRLALTVYAISEIADTTQIYGGTQSSGCITPQGDVWFPSNKGPIHILPLPRSSLPPPAVHLQDVLADGMEARSDRPVKLQPGNSRLEITWAPVWLRSQDGIRFRYKLEGFEDKWTNSAGQRMADYTNLSPGRYRFRVQAFEVSNPSAVSEATTDIVQLPHFYRTPWFLVSCVAMLMLIIFGVHRMRVQQVRVRFEAVLQERSRLAREMHDTVIQGCASVSALLEALSSMNHSGGELQNNLMDTAREQVRTTIDEARQAVWNLRHETGAVTDIGERISRMAGQVMNEFGVLVVCESSGKPFALSQSAAHELLMVAREAVYNSALHGSPGRIEVHLTFARRELVMSVLDNGRGFNIEKAAGSNGHHYGLVGMRERVERTGGRFRIDSTIGKGTHVEVQLPRDSSSALA